MEKIGVFGDSFADPIPGEDSRLPEMWMAALSHISTTECISHGICGTSVWKSYELFLENYHKYSHIVFVYTQPHRIPHLSDDFEGQNYLRPDTLPNLEFYSKADKKRVANVIDVYWKNLQNDTLDLFLYQKIFDDVNEKCYAANINLVNVFPFETVFSTDQIVNTTYRHGDCLFGVQEISVMEAQIASNPLSVNAFDPRDCHLTKENNAALAELVYDSFKDNAKKNYYLNINPTDYGFVFDREISDRYFKGK